MNELKEKQNEIVGVLTRAIIGQYKAACIAFPEPGQRLTLAMGTAMVGITASHQLIVRDAESAPTRDELLFTCLLISNSAEFTDFNDQKDALIVEFSFDNIVKTIQQFRDITGRSIEDRLNESLVQEVQAMKAKAMDAFVNDLTQFRPQ